MKNVRDTTNQVRCKYCNVSGFTWSNEGDFWHLIDSKGEHHKCQSKESLTAIKNEMKVVNGLYYHYTNEEPNKNDSFNKILLNVLVSISEKICELEEKINGKSPKPRITPVEEYDFDDED